MEGLSVAVVMLLPVWGNFFLLGMTLMASVYFLLAWEVLSFSTLISEAVGLLRLQSSRLSRPRK